MQDSTQGFRLSPQQRNLWLLQETNPEQLYRISCALQLEGDLQARILERALYDVVARHEILRTTFHRPPGVRTPYQVISDNAHPAWQAIDLSQLNSANQEHRIESSLAEERARRFDFERGPLLRVSLFKLSPHRRVMTVSLPALCADAATVPNFVRELHAAYQSILHEQDHAREVMQYADFSEWQNELREANDEQVNQGQKFWGERAGFLETPPIFPREQKSEAVPPAIESVPLRFTASLCTQLEALATDPDFSLTTFLFANWQALVWRLTGQSEFVIFNLFDGRKLADLEGALGLYDSYLPVWCRGGDVPFQDLLAGARRAIGETHEWLEFFEHRPTNDQVGFEFTEWADLNGDGLAFSICRHEVFHQAFKIKLVAVKSMNGLSVELRFDRNRFDRPTIERMAGYFESLVAQTSVCVSSPTSQQESLAQPEHHSSPEIQRSSSDLLIADVSATRRAGYSATCEQTEVRSTSIGAIDILGAAERRQLLVDFNLTEAPFSHEKCIHQLFEAQVERTPSAPALVFEDTELSYTELNARSNQLAYLLKERGAKANDRVGLNLPRSADVIVGLLGTLKAGAAYVPLNPEHPKERLSFQLAESQASLLITNTGSLDEELKFEGATIDLQLDREALAAAPDSNLDEIATPENLAYVIYTSGSTGVAKGVAIQHRNLVNYTEFILELLKIDKPLHFATVTTITADLGNTCIFPALLSGGCLHVLSYDVAMEGELFSDYVSKRPIDVLKIVPSHLQALLAAQPNGGMLPTRTLLLGGEALPWELVEKISSLRPDCQIFNHYGPTETTVGSLTFRVGAVQTDKSSMTVPIGKPIANTRAYVLDRYLQPQPSGVAGELFIGGAGVSAGYLNQPAETSARFVADPFTAEAGARLYRTGDLARSLPDGNLEFLGRIDNQIKVRGFRVELGEVEAVLATHAAVQQAVVIGQAGEGSSDKLTSAERLIAYIVPQGSKPPTADDLRSFLTQRLPDYMIPSAFMSLKTIPLTPNGKVDRAALPKPDESRPEMLRVFVAPRNETERELAGIWAGLLKVDEVGVHDNFFELGGHSLLATQVVSRMRQAFQTEIPLRSLFEAPTVA